MKFAVLGLGSAGSRHVRNLSALGHQVLGFDPDGSRAEGRRRATTASEAIAWSDAVVVAGPSAVHALQARQALEAGKHVLVEKPLAVTAAEAEGVAAAARGAGLVCAVAMNLRFHPAILQLRQLIEDGRLGEIRFAQASFGYDLRLWRPNVDYRNSYSARDDRGGGILLDAIHELDYLLWLLGPVASVSGEVARVSDLEIDVEDLALGLIHFASGAFATVDLSYLDPVYRRSCVVVGAEATARWDWTSGTISLEQDGRAPHVLDVRADVGDTYRAELEDFVEAVEAGRLPVTSADDGLAALRVVDALRKSSKEGKRVRLQA